MINLFIVGISQSIVIFLLFKTPFLLKSESHILEIYLLIIACTVSITLGGYFINDYFDYDIDAINKKATQRLDKVQLLRIYFINNVIGLLLALGICSLISNMSYLLIYISAISLLFLYASHFKRQGLTGNLVVSLFSSLVIGLLWFVQVYFNLEISSFQRNLMIFFMCFIFLSSMARELIKDCEDIEGDEAFGLKTLPINIGLERTNIFIGLFLIVLLIVCVSWSYWLFPFSNLWSKTSMVFIVLFNTYIVFKNFKASTINDYSNISKLIKALMGLGIISLSLISLQL